MNILALLLLVALLYLLLAWTQGPTAEQLLFGRFPLSARRRLPHGEVPVPYHNYDSRALVIAGTCEMEHVAALAGEDYQPVRTSQGRAVGLLWLMDYRDTSIGPYRECVVTFLVARDAIELDDSNPYRIQRALLCDPRIFLFMHRLWVTTTPALEYGRLLLGADKLLGAVDIERTRAGSTQETHRFEVRDENTAIVTGRIDASNDTGSLLAELPRLVGAFGLRLPSLLFARVHGVRVLGQPGVMPGYEQHHPMLQAYFAIDALRFELRPQQWQPDWELAFQAPGYDGLDFRPSFILHGATRFVFLSPFNPGDTPSGSF